MHLDREHSTYIAGHKGLVGSAIWRYFESAGFTKLIGASSNELDLRNREATFTYFAEHRPRFVIVAAARVGGILFNATAPHEIITDNLAIQLNVIEAALQFEVEKLLFLGSSCIYPKFAPQPIKEDSLLTGPLEPTNEAYAMAKIAGILQIQSIRKQYGLPWISAMPTNLYGPFDNFSPTRSHLLPGLIRRYSEAVLGGLPSVTNWGTGTPRRELLHVDDLAIATLHLLEKYDDPAPINVGTGEDLSIAEIADLVSESTGFTGQTMWDHSKPDGTPRKVLDISRITALGWKPTIDVRTGIESTVDWYRRNINE